jgi:ribonuclease HII
MAIKSLFPQYELEILESGKYSRVIGIDEVGRGCLAGPVAVGAYSFSLESKKVEGINDSKQVSEKKRIAIHKKLSNHKFFVEYSTPEEIDSKGIAKAIESLIKKIIEKNSDDKAYFLIDGRFSEDFGNHSETIINGDSLHYSIAAAAILAKVERDNLMRDIEREYPEYGFAKHKGYGTKQHREAIKRFGFCPIHRKSFKPQLRLV